MQPTRELLLTCFALATIAPAAQTQEPVLVPERPVLTHTAPELGKTIFFTLAGAPPLARAQLRVALAPPPAALAARPAEYAKLCSQVQRADARGRLCFALQLPADPRLAERELFVQAVVQAPGQPGGLAFTRARRLSILASRIYFGVHDGPATSNERLVVFSSLRNTELFSVPFEVVGSPSFDLAFSTNRATFALLSHDSLANASEILVLDNFTGATLHRIPAPNASGRLIESHDGRAFHVLRTAPAPVVETYSFRSGALLGSVALGGPVDPRWITGAGRTRGYLRDTSGTQAAVRRVDLTNLIDLGLTSVGAPGDNVLGALGLGAGYVLAVSTGSGAGNTLSRIDFSTPTPSVLTLPVGATGFDQNGSCRGGMLVLPHSDRVLTWISDDGDPFFPSCFFTLLATPLAAFDASTPIARPPTPPGVGFVRFIDQVSDGRNAWFADRCCQEFPDSDEAGVVYALDGTTGTWSVPETLYYGPNRIALLRDPVQQRILTSHWSPHPSLDQARLVSFDDRTGWQTVLRPTSTTAQFDLSLLEVLTLE